MIWGYLLTVVGLLAIWLVPKHPRIGWSVGLASEALWMAYAVTTGQPGFIVGAVAYGAVYTRNLWRCCRKQGRYAAVKIPLKYNYGKQTVKVTGLSMSSFSKALDEEMKVLTDNLYRDTKNVLWGDQNKLSTSEIAVLRKIIREHNAHEEHLRVHEDMRLQIEEHKEKVREAKKLLASERRKAQTKSKAVAKARGGKR